MNVPTSRATSTTASLLLFIALSAAAAFGAHVPTKVTTVAGGYVGDWKPATSASLADTTGITTDAKGNLYISDGLHCRIRRVNSKGIISTVAGTGICGYSGDSGPAKSATLSGPTGLAMDRMGNLFFADQNNFRVREITSSGTITTVAGNGTPGNSGDGGPANQASIGNPSAVFVDSSGNLYIADLTYYVIRMVDTAGTIHTVAGNGTYGFSGDGGPATSAQLTSPRSVVTDGSGNIYIADSANGRVRKVDSSGTITTWAGGAIPVNSGSGGPAIGAGLGGTSGLLLTGGKLYISTAANIWSMDQSTQIITLIAGVSNGALGFNGDGNPALATNFFGPAAMTLDNSGSLLVAETGNQRVRKIDSAQMVSTIAGGYVGDGGIATVASLNPAYLGGHPAVDVAKNVYVPDTNNNRVRRVSSSGTITTFAGNGITGYSGDGGPANAASLNEPTAVVLDSQGNLFIADNGNGVIRKVDVNGIITTFVQTVTVPAPWGGTIPISVNAYGLALDANGYLYAALFGYDVIVKIAPDGTGTIVAGMLFSGGYNGDGIAANQAQLNLPTGVAVDAAGNLYIADWENERIRKVDSNGIISTFAGTGAAGFSGDGGLATAAQLSLPNDVATDAKGNVYISDFLNFRVRVVNAAGTIQTVAGTGAWGYNGNNLAPTLANLFPVGITVGQYGVIYITDLGSDRVRKIH